MRKKILHPCSNNKELKKEQKMKYSWKLLTTLKIKFKGCTEGKIGEIPQNVEQMLRIGRKKKIGDWSRKSTM